MAERNELSIYIEEAPWGGWTVSSLEFPQENDGGVSGSYDDEDEALSEMSELAKRLVADGDYEAVEVLVDGSQEFWVEREAPKKRKSRAKKANPAQQSLFGHRRR